MHSPTMLKHCNPITGGGILVLPKLLHITYDLISVSKMATTWVGFEFRKQIMEVSLVNKEECGSNYKPQLAASTTAT